MKVNANLFSFLNKQDLLPETCNLDKISGDCISAYLSLNENMMDIMRNELLFSNPRWFILKINVNSAETYYFFNFF